MKICYRWILGVYCALFSINISANTFESVGALEQALFNCEGFAVKFQATCLSEVLTSDELEQNELIQEITSWQNKEAIDSIFSISTNVVIEGLLIDKSVRLATINSMAIIQLRLTVDQANYRVSDVSLVSGESSVMDNVCGNSCHS